MKKQTRTCQYVNQFYEKTPKLYDEITQREDPENKILEILLKDYNIKNKIVLDLGAGTGRFSIPLAKKSKYLYSLDISKKLLDILRTKIRDRKIKNIKILNVGYSDIPLPDKSMDIIISSWSFPAHSKDKDDDLKEIKRVLKKGGKIVIILMSNKGELQTIITEIFKESIHRIDERLKWLKSNGFEKHADIDININFDSAEMTRKLGIFWGPHMVDYLLKRNKTSFKLGISIFTFQNRAAD